MITKDLFVTALILQGLFFSLHSSAQNQVRVSPILESVTVYPQGAEIECYASKALKTGRQTLVFSGLSSEIDPQSVSVSATNGVNVLGVTTQRNYLHQPKLPVRLQALKDSLEDYRFDFAFNKNMIEVYGQERTMIFANQKIGWEKSQFVIEDLEDLSDFYRDRLADIMLKVMELEQKQKWLQTNIDRISRQLKESSVTGNRAQGEVLVDVQVTGNVNARITLKYMVRSAGWTPSYKVMVADVDKPLNVAYNAKVYQNSGISWEGVTLTLTNANPNMSGQKPDLTPWRLEFESEERNVRFANKAMMMESTAAYGDFSEVTADDDMDGVGYTAPAVAYAVNKAITRFEIRTRYSIPSNGKPQVIGIDAFTIPARYEYFASPKLDPAAFLIAKVGGFEKYDLLPGEANLFLSNTFVGQAYIDPNIITDTLELSLGRDQSIIVRREKVKDFEAARKIGNSMKETIGIKLSVRNTKSGRIKLHIEDQVPVSGNKDIEVNLEEAAGADHKEATGKLKWSLTVPASGSLERTFRYSVKYPSDQQVNF